MSSIRKGKIVTRDGEEFAKRTSTDGAANSRQILHFRRRKSGMWVCDFGSTLNQAVSPFSAAYCATKGTEGLRRTSNCGHTCQNRCSCVASEGGGDGSYDCTARSGNCVDCNLANGGGSPIIIDTEGEGYHFTSSDKGLGSTSPAKEFGNFTAQPPSTDKNGFLALAIYDLKENGGNEDGWITAEDTIYSKLRLWIDANHDGISQPGELYTLASRGVLGIGLKFMESKVIDQYGNQFRYRSTLRVANKAEDSKAVYDVFLARASGGKK